MQPKLKPYSTPTTRTVRLENIVAAVNRLTDDDMQDFPNLAYLHSRIGKSKGYHPVSNSTVDHKGMQAETPEETDAANTAIINSDALTLEGLMQVLRQAKIKKS